MQHILTYALVGLYFATIIGTILVIISDNRNPLKTMPWILVLVFAPIVGLVLYFFFGQNIRKQKLISHRTRRRITTYPESEGGGLNIPPNYLPLAELLLSAAHAAPLCGTQITPYISGAEKLEALLTEIAAARHHIHIQYYIICDDRSGGQLQKVLMEKARAGVQVRILYDDVGCRGVKESFFQQMRDAGVEVSAFLHVRFPLLTSKINYRNHRKIAVIDGRIGFLGGMNIADRYVYGSEHQPAWRDTHFRLEGGAVSALQASFLSDWTASTHAQLPQGEFFPAPDIFSGNTMQIITSNPFELWHTLLQAVSFAISNAKQSILIQTPYFLPSDGLNTALQTAALGGIDVHLILPEHSDSKAVDLAVHSFIDDILKAGVRVSFYTAGFIHSKLLIVDNALSIIGSANMDFRSFEYNFEINAVIYDKDFATTMTAIFKDDLQHCRRLIPVQWFRRPLSRRLGESFMRLFSPLF